MIKNMRTTLTLALLFTLASCIDTPAEGRFYRRLARAMRDVPAGDTVVVRIADLFTMPWDTMYVFTPMSHRPVPGHYQNHPYYHDIGRRIVLVKDGRVVFREDEIAVEWAYSVSFADEGRYFYTPRTAVFNAYLDNDTPNRPFFVLSGLYP